MAHESNESNVIPLTSSFVSLVHLVDSVTDNPINNVDNYDNDDGGDNDDDDDGKTVHRKKKKNHYFEHHIRKILKKISTERDMTQQTKIQLNEIAIMTCKFIRQKIFQILQSSKKKTITSDEVESAVTLLFSGQLAKEANDEGRICLQQYNSNIKELKGQSRHTKASILIPPSILDKLLRDIRFQMGYSASIFLAGVIEHFIRRLIELSIQSSKKGVRITVHDVEAGIRTDKEMSSYFTTNNIYLFESGIVPFVHPVILQKSGKNDKKSVRLMNKLQETNRHVFPRRFFENRCKTHLTSLLPELRYQKECFSYLQNYLEKWTTELLQYTNILTIYSKKSRLTSKDIELVSSIMERRWPSFLTNEKDE